MGSDGGGGGVGRSQDCPHFDNLWGQSEQSCVQETSTVRYCWMSLVPHGVPYRALCKAAVQAVVFAGKHPLFTMKLFSPTFPFSLFLSLFLSTLKKVYSSFSASFFGYYWKSLIMHAHLPLFMFFFFCSFVFGQDLIITMYGVKNNKSNSSIMPC